MIPVVLSVQVRDISTTGVLLATDHPLTPGQPGLLCLDINGNLFRGEIQVERVACTATASDRFELGASFLSLSPEHRHLLRRMTQ